MHIYCNGEGMLHTMVELGEFVRYNTFYSIMSVFLRSPTQNKKKRPKSKKNYKKSKKICSCSTSNKQH